MILKNKGLKNKGFTLIELLVSVTLFTIILTIALTALYSILKANDKTKTLKMVINNLNMAMESMSREIRVGYDYTCGSEISKSATSDINYDCNSSAGSIFSFKTKDGRNAYFKYENDSIKRKITGEENNAVSIVGDDIKIDKLDFYVTGTQLGDNVQPRVLVILKGSVNRGDINSTFNLQTTISQRKLAP